MRKPGKAPTRPARKSARNSPSSARAASPRDGNQPYASEVEDYSSDAVKKPDGEKERPKD